MPPIKTRITDIYKEEFFPSPHVNFLCIQDDIQSCVGVVSVLETVTRPPLTEGNHTYHAFISLILLDTFLIPSKWYYKCLFTDKTGSTLFNVSVKAKEKLQKRIISYLNANTHGKKYASFL